ncbi:hypothetical protein P153DRAFT_399998 [Dothidotthia symphoricarpi CBS 119687]|uniref:F-box domain-containing protein n=1 Tax=Dothidotthia symphoricarpi CBS 119687 TaxID=1392245 RepID=A0A6A6A3V7_9PLEO|nr:uncharacterized protein P153DRAFT_399998 [Dothidotthia symphoricarpi CBS 119687]KAF2125865.1 hypothetical protein P153DRAFT_399998 [Dothidotthia symphoricarpi CBS 119687]
MANPMPSPIEGLPVEILDMITTNLDLPAYQALRLTSRHVNLLSLSNFAKTYFSELTTTLSSPSLDRLLSICRSNYWSSAVTLLDIKLFNHEDYQALTDISRIGMWPPPKRFTHVPVTKPENISGESTLYNDVLGSNYPDCIVDRLVRSLQGFSNLKAVRFRTNSCEPFDWSITTMPRSDEVFRSRCFHAVLDAITKSNINLQEFTMARMRKSTMSRYADIPHSALLFSTSRLAELQSRSSNLKSLTCSIIAGCDRDTRSPGWENGLSKFIAIAPNLQRLALSLDRSFHISRYSASVLRSLALSCRLSQLEDLHLCNCLIHEEDLTVFVRAHAPSLRQLTLANIHLLTGSWISFWIMLKEVEGLQRFRIADLHGTRGTISFRRHGRVHEKTRLDVKKTGRRMVDMLDHLIAGFTAIMEAEPVESYAD